MQKNVLDLKQNKINRKSVIFFVSLRSVELI